MNIQELDKKELNNIYLLSGDSYLMSTAKKAIAQQASVADINISEFNDENFDALAVINACNQFSFFAEKRIVYIGELGKDLNSADKKMFESYAKSPNMDCILLICNNSGYWGFIKEAEKIECTASESFLSGHIKGLFEQNGKKIDASTINKLATFCLGNINRINLEIKKICDFMGGETVVTSQIIDDLVSKDTELKVFDLTVALSAKNIQKSQQMLYDMLNAGEPPIKILGLIASHFRRMFYAKINKGTSAELAKALGCKEFAVTKAKQQAEKFTAKQLKDIQNLILEVDYSIKSGAMTQENALYYLIFKIVL